MLADTSIKRDGPYGFFRRAILTLRKKASVRYRDALNDKIRDTLKDVKPFTIFSNNCLGGVFYHDAGLPFTSPLINTAMDAEDFLKFLNDPEHYLDCEMEFFTWPGRDFPIARLDDVEINFVHY